MVSKNILRKIREGGLEYIVGIRIRKLSGRRYIGLEVQISQG